MSIFYKSGWYYQRKLSGTQLLLLCMKQKMWGFRLWNQTLSLGQDWAPEHPAVLWTGCVMVHCLPQDPSITQGAIWLCRLRRESNSWTLSKHANTIGCLWWFVSLDLSQETWGLQSKFLELHSWHAEKQITVGMSETCYQLERQPAGGIFLKYLLLVSNPAILAEPESPT